MYFFIAVMLVTLNIHYVDLATIRYLKTITEDTTFYYKQLTTYPSLIVEVEFSILCIDNGLRLNMYTTKDNVNLQKNCTAEHGDQLHNEDLWVPLRLGNYRHYICIKKENGPLFCRGKTIIQDFKARNIGFSIGYGCDHLNPASLKGLSFNISVSGQRNKTDCVPLHYRPRLDCSKFYSFVSFPNLWGQKQQEARDGALAFRKVISLFPDGCYKFLEEMLCYIFIPKYDVMRNVTVPPCRENCWDFEKGCLGIVQKAYPNTKIFLNCNYLPEKDSDITCYYRVVTCEDPPKIPNGKVEGGIITNGTHPLHTQLHVKCINETFVMKRNNTITCQYTGTWSQPPRCVLRACPVPPMVEHAHIDEHQNGSEVYPWHTKVTYICDNKTYHMEGNSTVTCLKNGHWSPVPDCVEVIPSSNNQEKLKTLEVALPTVFAFVISSLIIIFLIIYRKKLRLKNAINTDLLALNDSSMVRIKAFDAYICYHFDTDQDFVNNFILPELEEKHLPAFKLCIHNRDFELGCTIEANIQFAIENSNSAIMILSQNFVDSMWCRQEFANSVIENMKDPAFKVFVILMDSEKPLKNMSPEMKKYIENRTYVEQDDPELISRIAKYLIWVKQPKDDNDSERNHENGEGTETNSVDLDEAKGAMNDGYEYNEPRYNEPFNFRTSINSTNTSANKDVYVTDDNEDVITSENTELLSD